MKKLYFAAAAIATLSFASCSQQLETEPSKATTFEITVNAPTRTAVDDAWNVTWEDSDAIQAVINTKDAKFTNNGGNKFVTTGFAPVDGTDYTWNFLSHKDSQYFTSSKIGEDGYTTGYFALPATAVQKKAGDKSHLGGQPLYGYATTVGTESPAVNMKHLTTVIVVEVTNSTTESIDITDIIAENDSDAAMSGTFYINCAEGKVKSKSPTTSVSMSVTDGAIAAGETAEFYIPAVPFAIAEGKNITIVLKSGDKKAEFVKNIPAGKTFAAGKFNSTSVTVAADTFGDNTIEKLTVNEFLAKKVSSTVYYELTGTVTNLTNTTYGNFDLKDNTGSVYVYGLLTEKDGESKKFTTLGVKEGDRITLVGTRGEFKNNDGSTKDEVLNAYYVSHESCKAFTAALDKASVTADAGTATIKITADNDVNWTITNGNEAVFTLSETSGTGSKDITVTYTANESTTDSRVANFVVSTSDFVATSSYSLKLTQTAVGAVVEKYYAKVTSNVDLTDGQYLIVCESKSVAFDGSLTSLDAAENTITISISNGKIKSEEAVDNSAFTYDSTNKTLKSTSGYYIGQTKDANGLLSNKTTTYSNSISFSEGGDANIVSSSAYLRYNATSQKDKNNKEIGLRFRYYKSKTYSNQTAIQLYKLEN